MNKTSNRDPDGLRRRRAYCFAAGITLLAFAAATSFAQSIALSGDARQNAIALEQQGSNADAEAAWRLYLKSHPSSSEAYAHLGLLEARQEHYQEAIPLYRKALALGSALPGLQMNLGLALFKGGEPRQALAEFTPLLKRARAGSPERQRLTILAGMCHYGLGEYTQAVPFLKEAAAGDRQNLALLMALAHSCLWTKQFQCVLDTDREILTVNPESAEADMLAGEALDEMKDSKGAIEQFRAAAKADPRMPDVHFGLGYLLWVDSQYQDALPEFQAELENNPGHAQALTYLADSQMKLNTPEHAGPLLEKAVQIDPRIELAHLDLATVDDGAGRKDDALKELLAAERLAPNDVDVHWRLGRLYRAMGKRDEATAEMNKAKSITQAADTALVNKMNSGSQPAQTPAPGPAKSPEPPK